MLAPLLEPLLEHWRERPQRTWSVVVTVMGDSIAPRGGVVRLGTLLALFAAMGIESGAVRTAMSRLVADGWLERERTGRTSSYSLGQNGRATFTAAAARIYAGHAPAWDGRLRLVLQPRDRAALLAAGYGQPLPGLFVAPLPACDVDEPVAMDAAVGLEAARLVAAQAWPLDRLAASFTRFAAAFAALPGWADPDPLAATVARTLLIHEYRRIALHAPNLPEALVPPGWPAGSARRLCAEAYAAVLPASEAWLDGQDLPAAHGLERRFS